MKKLITALAVIILLTSCSVPETAEAIATPATTTAVTFEMSAATAETTTATTKVVTTTATPTTTTPPETTTEATTTYPAVEIYAVEFPIEFLEDYPKSENAKPLSDEDYDTEVSPEAEKLYADYLAFTDKQILEDLGYEKYVKHNGYFTLTTSWRYYGLIDLNNDGEPEIFTYNTNGGYSTSYIKFYDLYGESPFTALTDFSFPGFYIDGVTYFGKNDNGNIVICSGYCRSESSGEIDIAELIYSSDTAGNKLEMGEAFGAAFNRSSCFYCDGYYLNGVTYGVKADIVPAADFEAAYREFYDAIDFDVYWICGDILYHGAEETEYKGKMAYEKYLEFTAKKTAGSRSPLLKPYELDINVMSEKEKDNLDFTNIRNELSTLDDDTLTKIEKAYIIARGISFYNIVYTGDFNSNLDEDSGVYYYGISYESYFNYLKTVFSEDMIDKLFADYKLFVDIDGELCKVGIGDRGSDPLYDYGVYSIKSTDSEKIEITLTAYCSDGDIVYQPSSYDIVLVKIDDEWKIDKFEYWC